MFDNKYTIATQLLRDIVDASMEHIQLLTMMHDCTGTIAIEMLRDIDVPSMAGMLKWNSTPEDNSIQDIEISDVSLR